MNVAEYVANYIVDQGTTHIFGYPGGMLTYFMEACSQYADRLTAHVCYHEQAAAFCACGYAQTSGRVGVAYATSGPGGTNLITGICNAWFDSIPTVFLTGQVNTFESKGDLPVRQSGFQETDIVQMVKGAVKWCKYVESVDEIPDCLERAWRIAQEGRQGPVLLDIPMNIWKGTIEVPISTVYTDIVAYHCKESENILEQMLSEARRPVLLIGGGVRNSIGQMDISELEKIWNVWKVPVVSSMLAVDLFSKEYDHYYGFIGAYGHRAANFIVSKSDLVISVGSRLDIRQVGGKKNGFAPGARLVRVDIDCNEFSNRIKEDELQIEMDGLQFLSLLCNVVSKHDLHVYQEWNAVCDKIKSELEAVDQELFPNKIVRRLSERVKTPCVITTDVGQNQVWAAQSWQVKSGQRILFSGGHGAMGYSVPAAIGAYYGSGKRVISLNGDGGFQMNMQELQFIVREKLPITIVIFNNQSLGMIRHFQEMYFEGNYTQTTGTSGYSVPDFYKLARAYGLEYHYVQSEKDIEGFVWECDIPRLVEIRLDEKTYVYPKLEYGEPNQDQSPRIDRRLYDSLMEL